MKLASPSETARSGCSFWSTFLHTICLETFKRYHEYLGTDIHSATLPDSFKMVICSYMSDYAAMLATFKEVIMCGKDLRSGPHAWASDRYDDWQDGCTAIRLLVPQISHGVLDVMDPIFRSHPTL